MPAWLFAQRAHPIDGAIIHHLLSEYFYLKQ